MPNHLKDVQAINMHVGLNCAKEVACCVDRLFSSNVWTKSPLWHCVGKSWSPSAPSSWSVPCRWPYSLQLAQLRFPHSQIASHLLGWWHAALASPFSWESTLTLPMEKIATWPKYPDPILTSLHICQNNFIENYYLLDQQGEGVVLFLPFFPSKNLYVIHMKCHRQERRNNGLTLHGHSSYL